MFCTKCGNELDDNAKFCDKCGTATSANSYTTNNSKEKIVDNEIQLEVRPTFKSIYFMWGTYIGVAFVLLFIFIISFAGGAGFAGLIAGIIFCLIIIGLKFLSLIFKKKQCECMKYDFYKTKVVYSDSFLNKVEKEVKYKYIRECVLTRTVSDRIFGFGRIVLYTNAESGYYNGIVIPCLEDSEILYQQIKELLDI